jgi:acyl-CoA-binding protein
LIHFPFERKKPERTGRKRKEYDDNLLNSVFSRYVNKQLSETDAKKELGTGCHIKDMVQFKEWAEKNGIDQSQNFGRSGRWYK